MPIETTTLDCGLKLVVEPMANARSAALAWLVPGGVARDPRDRVGRAAIWAELMLRGAGSLGSRAHADALDALGVNRSANAGMRALTLSATLLGDRLLEALPLLADVIRRPRFDPESIEPARALCLQALDALEDDPGERATLACRTRHFSQPFDRSSLGTRDGLASLTRDELTSAWSKCAAPVGSILAIAGHVDPSAIADNLNRLLNGWTGEGAGIAPGADAPRGYAHEADDTQQTQIVMMHDAPSIDSPDHDLERVASAVLAGGSSARLFTEVRERRALCYSVQASYSSDADRGVITAYVGTRPETAQEALDVLHAECERLATPEGAPTPEEFERAMIGLKSRLVFSGESTSARASALATDTLHLGRARSLAERIATTEAVTPSTLREYLSRRKLGRITVQTLGTAPVDPPA